MSDQPETLAAILAEMHAELDCIDDTKVIPVVYIKNRLPRIEAAAAREREAYCDLCKEKDATIDRLLVERDKAIKECAYVNSAAMRAALEAVRFMLRRAVDEGGFCAEEFSNLAQQADAALAAPARNCDRFANAEEAVAAFADHLRAWENAHGICSEYPDHAVQVPAGAFAWLFDKAEGGVK